MNGKLQPSTKKTTRLCIISDTHGSHKDLSITNEILQLLEIDFLLHCGDFTYWGNPDHLHSFNEWLGSLSVLPKERKIIVCGNHDTSVSFELKHKFKVDFDIHLNNGTLLSTKNSSVSVDGLTFTGFEYQNPRLADVSFWKKFLQSKTNILLTHNALSNTTLCPSNKGSKALRQAIEEHFVEFCSDKDFLHCFGHFHEKYGIETILTNEQEKKFLAVNASVVDKDRKVIYSPVIIDCFKSEKGITFIPNDFDTLLKS